MVFGENFDLRIQAYQVLINLGCFSQQTIDHFKLEVIDNFGQMDCCPIIVSIYDFTLGLDLKMV